MILIDSRIGSANLAHLFSPGVTVLTTLEAGDFAFIGNSTNEESVFVGIERKTLSDLIQSIMSGRLIAEQLPKMQSSYNIYYLVAEGIWRTCPQTGMLQVCTGWVAKGTAKWLSISGMSSRDFHARLNTLDIFVGVKLRFTSCPFETAKLVEALHGWWSKPFREHRSYNSIKHQTGVVAQLSKPSFIRRVAAELPGIGFQKSAAVATKFKTLKRIVDASEAELETVDGIGKALASKIYKAVRGIPY